MMLTNASAATTAIRVLHQCSTKLEPVGPWRWGCVVQNGACQSLTVTLGEGLLELTGQTEVYGATAPALEEALRTNRTLPGGVRFALESGHLHRRAELLLREGAPILAHLRWTLAGFHPEPFEPHNEYPDLPNLGPQLGLAELLRDTPWACTEREPNIFAVDLGSSVATLATICTQSCGLVLSAELALGAPATQAASQALTLFLLSANSAVRLARAYRLDEEGQQRFGFQVCLPPAPTAEELEEGLAALSVAHRSCAREAKVLVDDAAARCYLFVRAAQS